MTTLRQAAEAADEIERLRDEVKRARTTSEYWKDNHLAGNVRIGELHDEIAADTALLRQALEALEFEASGWEDPPQRTSAAIAALRTRLATG